MNADEIVRQLRGVQQKHAHDKLLTFQTDISAMARDCANLIESLQAQLEQKTNEAEGMRSNWYKCIENLKESQRRERAAVEYCKSPHYGDGDYYCGIDSACQGVLDILRGPVAGEASNE